MHMQLKTWSKSRETHTQKVRKEARVYPTMWKRLMRVCWLSLTTQSVSPRPPFSH